MINCLAERLRLTRKRYKLTLKEVSRISFISVSNLCAYERGYRTPSLENLLILSDIYNCSIDYLLGKDDKLVFELYDASVLSDYQREAIQILVNSIVQEKLYN